MKRIIAGIAICILALVGFVNNVSAAQIQMIDANNFTVTAETNKDVYTTLETIKIYAKITNNEKDQTIQLWGLKCQYIISKILPSGSPSYFKQGTVELTREEDWQAAAGGNSVTLKWITDYSQKKAATRLPTGQYYVTITFIDPYHSNIYLCGGTKIITVKSP